MSTLLVASHIHGWINNKTFFSFSFGFFFGGSVHRTTFQNNFQYAQSMGILFVSFRNWIGIGFLLNVNYNFNWHTIDKISIQKTISTRVCVHFVVYLLLMLLALSISVSRFYFIDSQQCDKATMRTINSTTDTGEEMLCTMRWFESEPNDSPAVLDMCVCPVLRCYHHWVWVRVCVCMSPSPNNVLLSMDFAFSFCLFVFMC